MEAQFITDLWTEMKTESEMCVEDSESQSAKNKSYYTGKDFIVKENGQESCGLKNKEHSSNEGMNLVTGPRESNGDRNHSAHEREGCGESLQRSWSLHVHRKEAQSRNLFIWLVLGYFHILSK